MKKCIYAMLLLISSLVLAACGGDGEDGGLDYYMPPSYGSIAINQNTGAGGITTSYSGQSIANSNALKQCGNSCITVLEFGSYMCGALARSDNMVFGWASDSKKSNAESSAINGCISRNGIRCQIALSNCNDS